MKYSDDLYRLVQSLTQSEKRYIKLYAQAFSSKGTDNQQDLLDAFEDQKIYDEEAIRRKFKDRIPARHFHVAKNRLYNLILRALQLFHAKDSDYERIHQYIVQADILRKKNLFDQAIQLFQKAKDLALEKEQYPLFLIAEQRLYMLYLETRNMQEIARTEAPRIQAIEQALRALQKESEYRQLEAKLMLLTHRHQAARNEQQLQELQTLSNNPLLQELGEDKGITIRSYYYFLNAFIARFRGDYQQSCHFAAKIVEMTEEDDPYRKNQIGTYVTRLNNLMFIALEARDYPQAAQTADKLYALLQHPNISHDEGMKFKVLERWMEFQLEYHLVTQQYQQGLTFIEQHQALLQHIILQTNSLRQLALHLALAALYLSNGLFASASEQLDLCLQHSRLKDFDYMFAGTMILNLLVHYELKHYQLLESLLLNTYRMMRKRNLLYNTEKVLLRYLKRFLKVKSQTEIQQLLLSLQAELQEAKSQPFERMFLDNFDLVLWIKSKLQGLTMNQYLQQQT
jgi:hypothetical protein